jgi:undecaprenyl-diphosphatase
MELTIFQNILIGIVQGITEWIPVSSSAFLVLIFSNFFHITDINFILQNALMLHLGTFFAALIYFRRDVAKLFVSLFKYRKSNTETRKTLNFLIIATIISGLIGLLILKAITQAQNNLNVTGKVISLSVGFLLLITGIIQLRIKNKGLKKPVHLKNSDGILLGFAQGLSTLPGLSRSGITVSTLLLRKFDDTTALKLSFLMSLPIVLIGNIFLNVFDFSFTLNSIYGLLASFIFGILTIHILMKVSKKINFGWFVLIFAILMMASIFI